MKKEFIIEKPKSDLVIFCTDPHFSSRTPISRTDDYCRAILDKFEYICIKAVELNAIVIIGGDIFTSTQQPNFLKFAIISIVLSTGADVYGIPGNHDIPYYNPDLLDKTSLGVIFASNVIKPLAKLQYGDYKIVGDWIRADQVCLDSVDVVISHRTITDKHDELFLSKSVIEQMQARFLCLGHDHNQYPPVTIKDTIVVRPGALSRGSSHTEVQVRKCSYAVLNLKMLTVEYVEVPQLDWEVVFKYKLDKVKSQLSFDDIKEFIMELKGMKTNLSPLDILNKMDLPSKIYRLVKQYLESFGLIESSVPVEELE